MDSCRSGQAAGSCGTVISIQVPQNVGNFLTSWTVGLSRRTLLCGVRC